LWVFCFGLFCLGGGVSPFVSGWFKVYLGQTQLSRMTMCTTGATLYRGMTKWPFEVLSAHVSTILYWHFWAQCWR